ncbi:GNAT family N-acetyltransferase [Thermoflavimicrobium daqui]|jgi:predicted GNAT superfamily acetyltransferase|uniref:GNAT family N-acetyltransferase n=1 Tax=Thermoflavimicrobium daqui TaxID=2137476 RepID=A0A364K4E3_9BACL|nr:GNAT family N-acetyltransferase [Thermoflavimicrobium daqui]RAL24207.1 GNAT family N-acetyltransferase [Thermoflavimicrobium daqui]
MYHQIKILQTVDELTEVQKLEQHIWQMDPIPVHQTLTCIKNGGMMLGIFHKEQLIGFCYGFPGFVNGKGYLCSHMLGIHPNYQNQGLGEKLKQAQREWAIHMGYQLITWTYDPLESINGYLNLEKLHGICQTYIENCYGEMEDALNQGLPSDRLMVEWWIHTPHVIEKQKPPFIKYKQPLLLPWNLNKRDFPFLDDHVIDLPTIWREHLSERKAIFIPIPTQFQKIKQTDFSLALDWRLKIRYLLQVLFAEGYALTGVKRQTDEPIQYYVAIDVKQLSIHDS